MFLDKPSQLQTKNHFISQMMLFDDKTKTVHVEQIVAKDKKGGLTSGGNLVAFSNTR